MCPHNSHIQRARKKSELTNYRPISILSPISKVFESLIAEQIYAYLESNQLLHQAQYGFRKGLSCEIALNTLIDEWRESLDAGNDTIAILIDLSKAFDTVDHELLTTKLTYYNFHNDLIHLLKSYLSNRSIKVKVNDSLSNSKPINIGVPQGSVLGPLLFILFINDFCSLDIKSSKTIFADDTTLSLAGKNISETITQLESDLALVSEWLQFNRLILNWKKTMAMIISAKKSESQLKLIDI